MEYDDNHVIVISSEKDIYDYIVDYRKEILKYRNSIIKEVGFKEFKKHTNDELYLKEQAKRCCDYLKNNQQFAFVLKTGAIISTVDNEGKLHAIVPK